MSRIILIGGPPRCGKTTLAQRVSRELSIPWISTDTFDDVVKEYVPAGERDKLFPKTALRRQSGGGNDEMYTQFSVQEVVTAYREQSETLYSAVTNFVDCAIKEGWDYVIEGYHITPELISRLQSERPNITGVIVTDSDGASAVKRSLESDVQEDWLRDKTQNNETYRKIALMVETYSVELNNEADRAGVEVKDLKDEWRSKQMEALNYLLNT